MEQAIRCLVGGGRRAAVLVVVLMTASCVGGRAAAAAGADPCAAAVATGPMSPQVHISRNGVLLQQPAELLLGDAVDIDGAARLPMRFPDGTRYLMRGGHARLTCDALVLSAGHEPQRTLILTLSSGSVTATVVSGPTAIETPGALAVGHFRGTSYLVRAPAGGGTSVVASGRLRPVELVDVHNQRQLRISVRPTQTGLLDRHGLRLDSWPFAVTPGQRRTHPGDGLARFEADGAQCSGGCRASAQRGWPLKPFHKQHPLRSGLNEVRPSGLHIGFDIQARDHQPVYAMESGSARVVKRAGPDAGVVQVGQFVYWHLDLRVSDGQWIQAYRTPLGGIHSGFRHVHLSEAVGGNLLNVLRPGGRTLGPWSDTEAPVIGQPSIYQDGRVIVDAFDPQSFVQKIKYETPVLAPAALAYRLFDDRSQPIGTLQWAFRSTRHLADGLQRVIFAPGASNPGFSCFALRRVCRPTWRYWLAGGLSPRLPLGSLGSGWYRLAIYAYDYADNVTARDVWFNRSGVIRRDAPPASSASLAVNADR